uniref:solute carrier family 22 member 15-like n=1 Tax=Styela clava TaxID=7725 RepID=UPI00193948B9|nr:solute carrier family 22 member 15-like [Styela clava]
MSYYLREWRSLQLGVAVASCVFPILWIFLPESPRWLLSKGEVEKGMKISDTIARRNGRKLPDDIWNQALIKDGNEMTEAHIYPHELFKRRLMKLITLRMMFIWFVCSLVYYGLSLNVGSLAGDTRINNALGGLCEILSCPLAIFTIDRFGRRPVLFIILIAAGFACIFSTAANYFSSADSALGVVGTIFALLGKLGISSAFAIIYNYTAELFPTVLRATAVGTGSMSARLGGICSPLVILIQYSLPWLPGVLFGALSLLAAAMCLYLPETKDAQLTTTLEDAEIFYAKARNLANPKKSNNDCHEMEKLDENLM